MEPEICIFFWEEEEEKKEIGKKRQLSFEIVLFHIISKLSRCRPNFKIKIFQSGLAITIITMTEDEARHFPAKFLINPPLLDQFKSIFDVELSNAKSQVPEVGHRLQHHHVLIDSSLTNCLKARWVATR